MCEKCHAKSNNHDFTASIISKLVAGIIGTVIGLIIVAKFF